MRVFQAGVMSAAVLAVAGGAAGDVVTFIFTGEVTGNSLPASSGAFASVGATESVVLRYTFDTDVVASTPGVYLNAVTGGTLTLGTLAPIELVDAGGVPQINVADGSPDQYLLNRRFSDLRHTLNLTLRDDSGSTFGSTALPTSLQLSDFSFKEGSFQWTASQRITWSIEDLQIVVVPLPAGALLGGAGLGLVCLARRRLGRA